MSIFIYIHTPELCLSLSGKKNPTMTQTDFAAGKNTVSLAENIYAKESLISKKEKNVLI